MPSDQRRSASECFDTLCADPRESVRGLELGSWNCLTKRRIVCRLPLPLTPSKSGLSPFSFSPLPWRPSIFRRTRAVARPARETVSAGTAVTWIPYNPFAKGAAVTLTVGKDNQSFKTQAKVVYSKTGNGVTGLLFTTAETRSTLRHPGFLAARTEWRSEKHQEEEAVKRFCASRDHQERGC